MKQGKQDGSKKSLPIVVFPAFVIASSFIVFLFFSFSSILSLLFLRTSPIAHIQVLHPFVENYLWKNNGGNRKYVYIHIWSDMAASRQFLTALKRHDLNSVRFVQYWFCLNCSVTMLTWTNIWHEEMFLAHPLRVHIWHEHNICDQLQLPIN